jgi:hypothetical protein
MANRPYTRLKREHMRSPFLPPERAPMIIQRLRALLFRSTRRSVAQSKGYAVVSADEAARDPYPYIFIDDDGTARELHAAERAYLEQVFIPFDGGRPYVKVILKRVMAGEALRGCLIALSFQMVCLLRPRPQIIQIHL